VARNTILVVGAGFSGAVVARELAIKGYQVRVIDKKDHVAGHAYDYTNHLGIRVHKYGPHLFHTSNQKVVDWLSGFTEWVPYQHKVKAMLADGCLVTLPVNAETKAIVGEENVLDIFFRPYTKKMWGKELEELDPSIINRVPIRNDLNELYFPNDTFQALPKHGYTRLMGNILDHPNIRVELNTAFNKKEESGFAHVFSSMPIDEYFSFSLGELPYRSIKFHTLDIPSPQCYPVPSVNFTHNGPYTRLTEWKNLPEHGGHPFMTTVTFEEPCDYKDNNMQRYYPVKDVSGGNQALYKKYREQVPKHVTFIGRCGMYVYIDMHQAVSIALNTVSSFLSRSLSPERDCDRVSINFSSGLQK
jgi:UDP-galactopyranose mutase